jgi:FkbM family methyltransferase
MYKKCIFTNDNNVSINLINNNKKSKDFAKRDKHEIIFRKINTFLINNKIINNNIIDLGAWIGDNSIPWAKNIKNIVYAIDPSTDNINFINEMCYINDVSNVKTLNYAISDKNEILMTKDNLNHCSFVYKNKKNINNEKKYINAVSLDYLLQEKIINNIGYIHLDVEGMEFKVLKGSIYIIKKYNPIITFEQHLKIDNYNNILSFLNDLEYEVYLIDEILPGCRKDCRNSIAFPKNLIDETFIQKINHHIGFKVLILK